MFLKVSKSYFFNILTKFIKIIDQNNPTPMLSGIYMHATHDLLTLTGADGSSVVQIAVNNHEQCQMIEPGIALIKIKFLFEIMKTIDDEMIDIRLHHNALLINGVDFNLNLCLMNAAEYPILFSADYETAVPITVAYETLENLDSKLCFHEKDGMKGVNFSYRSPTLDIS